MFGIIVTSTVEQIVEIEEMGNQVSPDGETHEGVGSSTQE